MLLEQEGSFPCAMWVWHYLAWKALHVRWTSLNVSSDEGDVMVVCTMVSPSSLNSFSASRFSSWSSWSGCQFSASSSCWQCLQHFSACSASWGWWSAAYFCSLNACCKFSWWGWQYWDYWLRWFCFSEGRCWWESWVATGWGIVLAESGLWEGMREDSGNWEVKFEVNLHL